MNNSLGNKEEDQQWRRTIESFQKSDHSVGSGGYGEAVALSGRSLGAMDPWRLGELSGCDFVPLHSSRCGLLPIIFTIGLRYESEMEVTIGPLDPYMRGKLRATEPSPPQDW